MCTLSWFYNDDGYDLFFNRDERKTRGRAEPPGIRRQQDIGYIAPLDIDAGGSWIAVNQFGVSLCLLNYYGVPMDLEQTRVFKSRGLLVLSLIENPDEQSVRDCLAQADIQSYRPFTLVALTPQADPVVYRWIGSGEPVVETVQQPPLSSSSFETNAVIDGRCRLLREMAAAQNASDAGLLEQYHRSHLPEKGPYSVCMHRDDAQTVSLSNISVRPKEIHFRYTPGSPCRAGFLPPVVLPRC